MKRARLISVATSIGCHIVVTAPATGKRAARLGETPVSATIALPPPTATLA
jgi:hypothetical protein